MNRGHIFSLAVAATALGIFWTGLRSDRPTRRAFYPPVRATPVPVEVAPMDPPPDILIYRGAPPPALPLPPAPKPP